jgi:hypothetical protein
MFRKILTYNLIDRLLELGCTMVMLVELPNKEYL